MGTGLSPSRHTFARCACLVLAGTALQFLLGDVHFTRWIQYPFSVIIALNFSYLLFLLCGWKRTCTYMYQMADAYSCSIVLLFLLVEILVMGITGKPLYHSWPFVFLLIYLMTILGVRSMIELRHLRTIRISGMLSHLSIYILLLAGLFGCLDKRRITVIAHEGYPVGMGINQQKEVQHLPFSVTLHKFILDELPATITNENGEKHEVMRPSGYASEISIQETDGSLRKGIVQVNAPMRVGSWYIYQKSYDLEEGKNSSYSVLECVRDGWYPVAYVSLWMLMLSAIIAIIESRKRSSS